MRPARMIGVRLSTDARARSVWNVSAASPAFARRQLRKYHIKINASML
jgi:hypothetical protein